MAGSGLHFAEIKTDYPRNLATIFQLLKMNSEAWSAQIFGDPDGGATYGHASGLTFLQIDVAMAIVNARAQAGDTELRAGIDALVKHYQQSSGEDPYGVHYQAMNSILPSEPFFGQPRYSPTICPELAQVLVSAYKSSKMMGTIFAH